MDQQIYKEVYFDQYCKTCKHEKLTEQDSPCDECLTESTNWNSHKPAMYDKKEKK